MFDLRGSVPSSQPIAHSRTSARNGGGAVRRTEPKGKNKGVGDEQDPLVNEIGLARQFQL